MRVVLDTNVLISTFLFGGRLQFIVDYLADGTLVPCFSHTTWEEFKRTLAYPHLQGALQQEGVNVAALLARLSIHSVFFPDISSPLAIPQDKNDEAILACAIAASARAVVTGDQHILKLADQFSIPILTPQEFKKFLAQIIA